jgi:GNAT superfamily N-acetyltransferase
MVVIEPATPSDAEALVAVQVAAFHDDARLYPGVALGGPPGYDSVDQMLATISSTNCFKISEGDSLIGGIIVDDAGGGRFHLDVLFVDPAWHNRGVGTSAMRFIEDLFQASIWTLDTPSYAIRNQHFYERLGYVSSGESDTVGHAVTLIRYEKRGTGSPGGPTSQP